MRMEFTELLVDLGDVLPNVNRNEESHHVNCTLAHNLAVEVLFVCTTFFRWLADLFQNL